MRRSLVTLAMMEAAAIERERESPLMMGRIGILIPGRVTASMSR
jgi:hypothetical protein